MAVRKGANSLAKTLTSPWCKQSGPWALLGSRQLSKFRTLFTVTLMSGIDGYGLLPSVCGELVSDVNTLLNCLFKISAFCAVSLTSLPFSLRGATPVLS